MSRFREEKQRIEDHFDPAKNPLIIELFVSIYITNNLKFLIENDDSGLKLFLNFDKFEDLKNLYFFASLKNSCFEVFKRQLCEYIFMNLNPLLIPNNSKKNFIEIIEKIFSFKEKIFKILEISFKSSQNSMEIYEKNPMNFYNKNSMKFYEKNSMNFAYDKNSLNFCDKNIEKTVKDSFQGFVNKDLLISNSLNKYLDFFMQKGHKKLNDLEKDVIIEKILDIFKLLINKDLFELYYKKLLTKRLIVFKNYFEELELNFLKKITIICGVFYTSKFYSYFKDMIISSQNFKDFQKFVNKTKEKPLKLELEYNKFCIEVISQNIWSFEENSHENFEFPEEIYKILKIFEGFYHGKHPERKLKWLSNIGVGIIKANYKEKPKEFILSNIQMFILLCFNVKKLISFKEIQAKLKINSLFLLKNSLKSFVKYKVLLRNNVSENIDIKEDDIFLVNEYFSHRNHEIKIPLKQSEESDGNYLQNNIETLLLERKIIIESFLIRILKARKKMVHADLIKEVSNFCANKNFVPNVNQIKDSIESLINREYIRREEDVNWYSYIA